MSQWPAGKVVFLLAVFLGVRVCGEGVAVICATQTAPGASQQARRQPQAGIHSKGTCIVHEAGFARLVCQRQLREGTGRLRERGWW